MVLGIISDCVHVKSYSDEIGSKVHVFVKQIDHLSTYFSKVYLCVPVVNGKQEDSGISVYLNKNIVFIPIPVAGGNSLVDKLKIAMFLPVWVYRIIQVCSFSDLLYLRAPNNISIPGYLVSSFFTKPRFSTYTGTWSGYTTEPFTYTLQRKYLSKYFKGPVFVYGRLPSDRSNVYNTISPSYSIDDWDFETAQIGKRIERLSNLKNLDSGIRIISVGALTDNKNQIFILEAMAKLQMLNVKFNLWIAGEGENLKRLQEYVHSNNLQDHVVFLGNLKQNKLREYYRIADIVIQAPIQEGFGKVPIEGFFHGVVPIISDVNLSREIVGDSDRGLLFKTQEELIKHIRTVIGNPSTIVRFIKNGREHAAKNTLEAWGSDIFRKIPLNKKFK